MSDASNELQQLLSGDGVGVTRRDVLLVSGPDAVKFLQGQLSQDIERVAVGASAWSLHLQPSGKLGELLRVQRLHDDSLVLDTDAGFGPAMAAGLERYKIRTKATIETLPSRYQWSWRGPTKQRIEALPPLTADAVRAGAELLADPWPSFPGLDRLVLEPPTQVGVSPEVWEAARIDHGVPVMGAELTADLIPAEGVVVAWAVSFTKGCYLGQELVARIDSRGGNVARLLRIIRSEHLVAVGDQLSHAGKSVGHITSAAPHPSGGSVALAAVARGVELGAVVVCGTAELSATVHATRRPDVGE